MTEADIPDDPDQRLMELLYGLLDDDEAEGLRRRMAEDDELAERYGRVRGERALLAEAALLPDEPVDLSPPADASPEPAQNDAPRRRPAHPLWIVAAALLVGLGVGAVGYERWQVNRLQGELGSLAVVGPRTVRQGAPTTFFVSTADASGRPAPGDFEYVVSTPGLGRAMKRTLRTDDDGTATLVLPDALPPGGRVQFFSVWGSETVPAGAPRPVLDDVPDVPDRAALHTDKPLYQPGDALFFRVVVRRSGRLTAPLSEQVRVRLLGPDGKPVPGSEETVPVASGVAAWSLLLADDAVGGRYTVVAESTQARFAPVRQHVQVRAYRPPLFVKTVRMLRDSYAPGDTLVADLSVRRVEGGAAAGATLRLAIDVGGRRVWEGVARTDASGRHRVEAVLPDDLPEGDARLVAVIDDGGRRETLVKAVPLATRSAEIEFFPEGGVLVANVANTVYFTARDAAGRPLSVAGEVRTGDASVARVRTAVDGRGRFELTPALDTPYRLRLTEPDTVAAEAPLPVADAEQLLTIGVDAPGVFAAAAPVRYRLPSVVDGIPVLVTAVCRGLVVGQDRVSTRVDREKPRDLPIDLPGGGVVRLTAYDLRTEQPTPLAERLVFCRPATSLATSRIVTSTQALPGQIQELSLQVQDATGTPVAGAVVGVSVVDAAVLAEAGRTQPSLPTQLLLSSEVEDAADLEQADVLLGADAAAETRLDLLLATQGWRRFAERTLGELTDGADAADRRLALTAVAADGSAPLRSGNAETLAERADAAIAAFRRQWRDRVTVAACGLVAALAFLALALFLLRRPAAPRAVAASLLTLLVVAAAAVAALATASHGFGGAAAAVGAAPTGGAVATADAVAEPADAAAEMAEAGSASPAPAAMAPAAGERQGQAPKPAPTGGFDLARAARPAVRGSVFGERTIRDGTATDAIDAAADAPAKAEPLKVRTREYYVHRQAEGEALAVGRVRDDFTETLLWQPRLVTDATGTTPPLEFDLSDAVTRFQVRADIHDDAGRLGATYDEIQARLPFRVEPTPPLQVVAGDSFDLPVMLENATPRQVDLSQTVAVTAPLRPGVAPTAAQSLAPEERRRIFLPVDAAAVGVARIRAGASAGRYADAVERSVESLASGYPLRRAVPARLAPGAGTPLTLALPQDVVEGSLHARLKLYPGAAAELEAGLESLLRSPHGCFEQASSANYPNVLVLDSLRRSDTPAPALADRCRDLLDRGYPLLAGYETESQGFEWFGQAPPHETLTAYGLMQFVAMRPYVAVDDALIDRTRAWLLSRRRVDGGFAHGTRSLDTFGRSGAEVADAYIVWALVQAGPTELPRDFAAQLDHVASLAESSADPYVTSLAAGALAGAGRILDAERLLGALAETQRPDGAVPDAAETITRTTGDAKTAETTALAALAWQTQPAFQDNAARALDWLRGRRDAGGYGSTQATVLTLQALSNAAAARDADGTLGLSLGGDPLPPRDVRADDPATWQVEIPARRLRAGDNALSLTWQGPVALAAELVVDFTVAEPPPAGASGPVLELSPLPPEVGAGESVRQRVSLTNPTDSPQLMPLVRLSHPAGLTPDVDRLELLRRQGAIAHYELAPLAVVLYWRDARPGQALAADVDFLATTPGRFAGRPSSAQWYYSPDSRVWADPTRITVRRPTP